MNREDIDKLWQQALIESVKDGEQFARYHFANLVAAAEREACAAMAEAFHHHQYDFTGGLELHEAIRARGNK